MSTSSTMQYRTWQNQHQHEHVFLDDQNTVLEDSESVAWNRMIEAMMLYQAISDHQKVQNVSHGIETCTMCLEQRKNRGKCREDIKVWNVALLMPHIDSFQSLMLPCIQCMHVHNLHSACMHIYLQILTRAKIRKITLLKDLHKQRQNPGF